MSRRPALRTTLPRHRLPLRLDALDARIAPAVFTVTNVNDSGAGSLRDAIIAANNFGGPDIVQIQTTGTLQLSLPASLLPDGDLAIEVDGLQGQGRPSPVARFPFRIARRS